MNARTVIFLALFVLTACADLPSPAARGDQADALAGQSAWQRELIATSCFTLAAYLPFSVAVSETLTVYIEGDGLAWINSSTPSDNPTPLNPLALKLALRDNTPSAYLARPCQFIEAEQEHHCARKYWTSHRFSAEVVESSNQAIDQLKRRFGAQHLILVGYSGGGAVAALVAARRKDVIRLITVAGNLDPPSWAAEHYLSPLTGSLNPSDAWTTLQSIPQTHFVGGKDQVVGESVARAYASRFPAGFAANIVVLPDFDHHRLWVEHWPALKIENHN